MDESVQYAGAVQQMIRHKIWFCSKQVCKLGTPTKRNVIVIVSAQMGFLSQIMICALQRTASVDRTDACDHRVLCEKVDTLTFVALYVYALKNEVCFSSAPGNFYPMKRATDIFLKFDGLGEGTPPFLHPFAFDIKKTELVLFGQSFFQKKFPRPLMG